jgi:hypothetical protein
MPRALIHCDDQQDRVNNGLIRAVARVDDRVQGQVQRRRALGGPDRPDRGPQPGRARVAALRAVEHGVLGEQLGVAVGVAAGSRRVGPPDDVEDVEPVRGRQGHEAAAGGRSQSVSPSGPRSGAALCRS